MIKIEQKPWYYLSWNRWNNSFSYHKWKRIWIAPVKIWKIDDLKLWNKIVFSDLEDWILRKSVWLLTHLWILDWRCPVFVCDNHNRALEAWQFYRTNTPYLIHIDQHRDEADYLNIIDFEKDLRVCDYIKWAKDRNWVQKIHLSLCESKDFSDIYKNDLIDFKKIKWSSSSIILNIDLDIFAPEQTLISHELIWDTIFKFSKKSCLITIASSPLFIDQQLALNLVKRFFKSFLKK